MKIYNSLTKQIEEFKPRNENLVTVYTCGPTVYHFAHIGNLRTYIMQDILVKTLKFAGYNVKRVMNITDVGHLSDDNDYGEDKMLKGAKREHKTVQEIAKFYTDAYLSDMKKLNNNIADVVEPATNCIDEFIKVISGLIEKGFAYKAGGNIYFDTSKLKEYHKFFNFKEEDLDVGVRESVEADENKRNVNDFVLWFTKSKFEEQAQRWESPWGVGYPGWHIECSCIAMKHLGEYVDIHSGGIDNAFPHHTNEIAQSEAYLGHEWCHYWVHGGHLNDKNGKMSKSSGEFLTLQVVENKGYLPLSYRFFVLQSNYRNSLLFTYENMDNAQNAYKKLRQKVSKLSSEGDVDAGKVVVYEEKFLSALNSDLNTPLAISVVYEVLKDSQINDATKRKIIASFDDVLSLDLLTPLDNFNAEIDEKWIQEMIEKRNNAKAEKNYALADQIRNELISKNIVLMDTAQGTKFEYR